MVFSSPNFHSHIEPRQIDQVSPPAMPAVYWCTHPSVSQSVGLPDFPFGRLAADPSLRPSFARARLTHFCLSAIWVEFLRQEVKASGDGF